MTVFFACLAVALLGVMIYAEALNELDRYDHAFIPKVNIGPMPTAEEAQQIANAIAETLAMDGEVVVEVHH